jgi:hypothetical protein
MSPAISATSRAATCSGAPGPKSIARRRARAFCRWQATTASSAVGELQPERAQALDHLGAVTHRLAARELEQPDRAHQLGLERRPQMVPVDAHDLRDRQGVGGVGPARPASAPIAPGAPGRHIEHAVPGRLQLGAHRPGEVAGALDADGGAVCLVLSEKGPQPAGALRAVGEPERALQDAGAVHQGGDVKALVRIDATEHGDLLVVRDYDRGRAGMGRSCVDAAPSARDLLSSHHRRPAHTPEPTGRSEGQACEGRHAFCRSQAAGVRMSLAAPPGGGNDADTQALPFQRGV